jgi:ribose transport system substrate-binding protein
MNNPFPFRRAAIGAIAAAVALPSLTFAQAAKVDVDKNMNEQMQLMVTKPQGPADQPWLQNVGGQMIDTAKYKKTGPHNLCFSNASVGNPWRVVGWNTMQAERDLQKAHIKGFEYADAQGKDEKQISDIRSFINSGKCDALIVSPNTAAALTPVIEEACKKMPVITFDRSVNTLCPVTAVQSIGGYAWGKAGADFVVANVPKGGNVLVLRTRAGLDVFETRWEAARRTYEAAGLKVVGNEFVGGDLAKTKAVITDYLNKGAKIDAVWVDLGAVSVAAVEAFEDAGKPIPVVTGEDQQDYLQAWSRKKFKGVAPTYPAYQWRTAVIATLKVLNGEPVPGPVWKLPQPVITEQDLPRFVDAKLPPLHYSTCGCEKMPGYPQRWGGKQ